MSDEMLGLDIRCNPNLRHCASLLLQFNLPAVIFILGLFNLGFKWRPGVCIQIAGWEGVIITLTIISFMFWVGQTLLSLPIILSGDRQWIFR